MKHRKSVWVNRSSAICFACLVSCSCPRKWVYNTKLLFDWSTGTWLQTDSGDHWADWSWSWPADAWREGGKPDRATQAHLYAVPAVHQDAYLQPRGCAPSQGECWYMVVKQSHSSLHTTWKQLPVSVRHATSVSSFQSSLKTLSVFRSIFSSLIAWR